MPQLEVSSYFSQVFWLVISFVLLYFIVKNFIVPSVERILVSRSSYIDSLLERAKEVSSEAERIDREADAELEKSKMELKLAESEELVKFRREADGLVRELSERNSARSLKAVKRMNKQLDMLYRDLEDRIPDLVEKAYRKIYDRGED